MLVRGPVGQALLTFTVGDLMSWNDRMNVLESMMHAAGDDEDRVSA